MCARRATPAPEVRPPPPPPHPRVGRPQRYAAPRAPRARSRRPLTRQRARFVLVFGGYNGGHSEPLSPSRDSGPAVPIETGTAKRPPVGTFFSREGRQPTHVPQSDRCIMGLIRVLPIAGRRDAGAAGADVVQRGAHRRNVACLRSARSVSRERPLRTVAVLPPADCSLQRRLRTTGPIGGHSPPVPTIWGGSECLDTTASSGPEVSDRLRASPPPPQRRSMSWRGPSGVTRRRILHQRRSGASRQHRPPPGTCGGCEGPTSRVAWPVPCPRPTAPSTPAFCNDRPRSVSKVASGPPAKRGRFLSSCRWSLFGGSAARTVHVPRGTAAPSASSEWAGLPQEAAGHRSGAVPPPQTATGHGTGAGPSLRRWTGAGHGSATAVPLPPRPGHKAVPRGTRYFVLSFFAEDDRRALVAGFGDPTAVDTTDAAQAMTDRRHSPAGALRRFLKPKVPRPGGPRQRARSCSNHQSLKPRDPHPPPAPCGESPPCATVPGGRGGGGQYLPQRSTALKSILCPGYNGAVVDRADLGPRVLGCGGGGALFGDQSRGLGGGVSRVLGGWPFETAGGAGVSGVPGLAKSVGTAPPMCCRSTSPRGHATAWPGRPVQDLQNRW